MKLSCNLCLLFLLVVCWASPGEDSLFEGFPQTSLSEEELTAADSITQEITIRMTSKEVALFVRYLSSAHSYFEFGCGGSTMVASKYGPADLSITSVDSSQEWLDIVAKNKYSNEKQQMGLLKLSFVDIGPTGMWGYPKQSKVKSKGAWYLYSQAISMSGGKYDIVLVDGRFRVACLLNTLIYNPAAKVLFHDFFDPDHHGAYKILLEVTDVVERVDTLAALKRKEGVSTEALMKLYATFIHVPERRHR